jgi:hypothetical protein
MSNDNVVDFPGLTSNELLPRAVLEAIAEDIGDDLVRVVVIAVDKNNALRLFNSCPDDDITIADLTRSLHAFVADTFED